MITPTIDYRFLRTTTFSELHSKSSCFCVGEVQATLEITVINPVTVIK